MCKQKCKQSVLVVRHAAADTMRTGSIGLQRFRKYLPMKLLLKCLCALKYKVNTLLNKNLTLTKIYNTYSRDSDPDPGIWSDHFLREVGSGFRVRTDYFGLIRIRFFSSSEEQHLNIIDFFVEKYLSNTLNKERIL